MHRLCHLLPALFVFATIKPTSSRTQCHQEHCQSYLNLRSAGKWLYAWHVLYRYSHWLSMFSKEWCFFCLQLFFCPMPYLKRSSHGNETCGDHRCSSSQLPLGTQGRCSTMLRGKRSAVDTEIGARDERHSWSTSSQLFAKLPNCIHSFSLKLVVLAIVECTWRWRASIISACWENN